ncbi:unnamed protein product, partial [Ectocarpus sp. 12 AP-2014]
VLVHRGLADGAYPPLSIFLSQRSTIRPRYMIETGDKPKFRRRPKTPDTTSPAERDAAFPLFNTTAPTLSSPTSRRCFARLPARTRCSCPLATRSLRMPGSDRPCEGVPARTTPRLG